MRRRTPGPRKEASSRWIVSKDSFLAYSCDWTYDGDDLVLDGRGEGYQAEEGDCVELQGGLRVS